MDSLKLITFFALVSLAITAAWAPLLISLLYRLNIVVHHVLTKNKMNQEFVKIHAHKSGTPTMGGLMISVTVGILAFVLIPQSSLRDIFLLGWWLNTMYGFIEGSMVFARKVDEKFKLLQETFAWRLGKLLILYLICTLTLAAITNLAGITSLNLFLFTVAINPITLILGGMAMVLAIYGMEITDGADGLVTGQFLIILSSYLIIAIISGQFTALLIPMIAMTIGSSLVYLYFNISPARVFMGGTGTLPIGFLLSIAAVLTNTVPILVIAGFVFWVELASSFSQIIAIRFFKRKIFKIAPIHHHFEAIGWPEAKVVQRFWLATAFFCLLALWIYSIVVVA